MEMQSLLFWIIAALTASCAIATVVTQNIVRSATWLLFTLAGTSGIFFLLGADLVGAIQLMVYVGGTLVLVVFGVMLTAQGPFVSMKTSSAEWAVSALVGLLLLGVLALAVLKIGRPGPPADSTVAKFAPKKNLSDDAGASKYSAVIGQGLLGRGVGPAHEVPNTFGPPRKDKADGKGKDGQGMKGKFGKAKDEEKKSDNPPEGKSGQEIQPKGMGGIPPSPKPMDTRNESKVVIRTNYLLPFEIVSIHLLVVLIGAAYLARAKRRRPPGPVDNAPASDVTNREAAP